MHLRDNQKSLFMTSGVRGARWHQRRPAYRDRRVRAARPMEYAAFSGMHHRL